jgi:hypothetical protein
MQSLQEIIDELAGALSDPNLAQETVMQAQDRRQELDDRGQLPIGLAILLDRVIASGKEISDVE